MTSGSEFEETRRDLPDEPPVGAGSPPSPPPDGAPAIPDITITAEIGRGGMGVVYRGRQEYLGRDVAVKVLSSRAQDSDWAARFRREAKILAGLSHPNIVSCYSAGILPDGCSYLVMEFIDGPNLRQWLDKSGPAEPRLALTIVRRVAEALAHGHRSQIIHRDVKPENVLLARRPDAPAGSIFPYEVKLADLGLARSTDVDEVSMHITSSQQVLGTPTTMAPEQFEDSMAIDHRADIYGLGCVLYHSLTGQFAYSGRSFAAIFAKKQAPKGPDPRELDPEIPAPVATLVTEMLARDPSDRPSTYSELITRIDTIDSGFADQTLVAPRLVMSGEHDGQTMVFEPSPPPIARRGTLFAAIAVVAAIVVGLILWSPWNGPDYRVDGPQRTREGESIHFRFNGLVDGESVVWELKSGEGAPPIALETESGTVLPMTLPDWDRPYAFELAWAVRDSDGNEVAHGLRPVEVEATNRAPTLRVDEAEVTARAGEPIEVVAVPDDDGPVNELDLEWNEPTNLRLEADGLAVRFTPPARDKSYEVELSVSAVDREGARSEPREIRVRVIAPPRIEIVDPVMRTNEEKGGKLVARIDQGIDAERRIRWSSDQPAIVFTSPSSEETRFEVQRMVASSPVVATIRVEVRDTGFEPVVESYELTLVPDDRYRALDPDAPALPLLGVDTEQYQSLWSEDGDLSFDYQVSHLVATSGDAESHCRATRSLFRGNWILSGELDDLRTMARCHGLQVVELNLTHDDRRIRLEVESRGKGKERTRKLRLLDVGSDLGARAELAARDLAQNALVAFRFEVRDDALTISYRETRLDYDDDGQEIVHAGEWTGLPSVDLREWRGRALPWLTLCLDGYGASNFGALEIRGTR
ncbi:MAG: serine/threonine protein kinase [Planctomycetes bacterium]|nr:serine/threonine protein kinase [Planctomycetota bacterium]